MEDNKPDPVLRLAKVIRERKEAHGGYSQLAEAIRVASQTEKAPLDRRKLRRIVDQDDTVTLSVEEIRALDKYLTPFGEGLADRAFLVRRSLLSSLSAKDQVMMLLGSHPRPGARNDVSRWDVRALSALQGALGHLHPGTHPKIDDVLLREELETDPQTRELFERHLKNKDLGVCMVGASRSNPASEGALCKMFLVEPFVQPASTALPFRFIWSPKAHKSFPSAFALDYDEIEAQNSELAAEIKNEKAWALLAEGELYRVPRTNELEGAAWKDYGIGVAQRRPGGRAWLVVAGLSGPATYAAALAVVKQQTGALPEAPHEERPSKICWSLVEATVERDETVPGDSRTVTDVNVVLRRTCDPGGQAVAD